VDLIPPASGALLSTAAIQYFIFTYAKHTIIKYIRERFAFSRGTTWTAEEGSYSRLEKIT
jgi:hypothetical protein